MMGDDEDQTFSLFSWQTKRDTEATRSKTPKIKKQQYTHNKEQSRINKESQIDDEVLNSSFPSSSGCPP